jgi:integrase
MKEQRANVWKVAASNGRHPLTGKPHYLRKTVHGSKKDAEKELTAMFDAIDKGKVVHRDDVKVKDWLNHWHTTFIVPRLRLNTVEGYRDAIKAWLVPRLGNKLVQKLTRAEVAAALLDMTASGLSASTVRQAYVILHQALDVAVDHNLILANPAAKSKGKPRLKPTRAPEEISPTEAVQILKAAKAFDATQDSQMMHVFVALALAVGARQGELLGLPWKHIDIPKCIVTIERQLLRVGTKTPDGTYTEPLYGPPKRGGTRRVKVDPATMLLLERHLAAQRKLKVKWGPAYHDSGLVFGREPQHLTEREDNALGRPLRANVVRHTFKRLLKAANLRQVRLHALRHCAATMMLSAGVPVPDVAARWATRQRFC